MVTAYHHRKEESYYIYEFITTISKKVFSDVQTSTET